MSSWSLLLFFEDLFAGIFFAFRTFNVCALLLIWHFFCHKQKKKKDQYSKYKERNHYHANNKEFTNLAWNYKKEKTTKIENANKISFPLSSSFDKWNQYFDLKSAMVLLLLIFTWENDTASQSLQEFWSIFREFYFWQHKSFWSLS